MKRCGNIGGTTCSEDPKNCWIEDMAVGHFRGKVTFKLLDPPALGAMQDNLTVDITHFGATRKGINGIQSYAKSEDKKLTIFSADPAVMALDTTVDRHINCRKSDITVELPGDLGTNLEGDTATGARSVLPACPRSFSLPAEDLLPTLGRLASA
jgi:hypothetical protein